LHPENTGKKIKTGIVKIVVDFLHTCLKKSERVAEVEVG
jgi:hypothetical protein